jgi:cell division protein FtsQ
MDSKILAIKEYEQTTGDNERRSIKKKYALLFLFLIFSLFMLVFLRLPLFNIKEINITGLDKVTSDEVLAAAGLREGMSIWRINSSELDKRISTLPRVAEVRVERNLPSNISIAVIEKYPMAIITYHGSFLELASDGLIIGIKDDYRGEHPLINGLVWGQMDVGTNIPDQLRRDIIDIFLEALTITPALPLAEINVNDSDHILVYTWEGMEVWLGGKQNLDKKLEVLKQLHQYIHTGDNIPQRGYLDIRTVESPVYVPLI